MKILLIGSFVWGSNPRDKDIICEDPNAEPEGFDTIRPTDADQKWIFSGALDDHLSPYEGEIEGLGGESILVPSEELHAHIYRSHLTSFRKAWWKHYRTFHAEGFAKVCAKNEDERLAAYTSEREKEYRKLSRTRSWTLKGMEKEAFFGSNVTYYQDHDSVHASIAFEPSTPAYTYMQDPGSEVECSKKLWDGMTPEQRLNSVKEEMAVIAIERFIAPLYFQNDYKSVNIVKALRGAAYKLNTTLSSGWFRRFVVQNGFRAYNELVNDVSWLRRWIKDTESGKIKSTAGEMGED